MSALGPVKTFLVGGAVRDRLLGLPVSERDWVVVGASPPAMIEHGFRPVGRNFPVFLHPQTNEEYALARTERKTGKGYHGFVFYTGPDVTLEQDLQRRDLTINAMALDATDRLIDPFNGSQDLRSKVLRHVSSAFSEDPVRVLRVARFLARFEPHGFRVAESTLGLMRTMSANGEISALVAERVWKEFTKALTAAAPAAFFHVLEAAGALKILAPELDALFAKPRLREPLAAALRAAASRNCALSVFVVLASWAAAAGLHLDAWCGGLKAPRAYRQLAHTMPLLHALTMRRAHLDAESLLRFFKRNDLLRNPQRFKCLESVWSSCALPQHLDPYHGTPAWKLLDMALQTVVHADVKAALSQCRHPGAIKAAVVQEQTRLLDDFLARLFEKEHQNDAKNDAVYDKRQHADFFDESQKQANGRKRDHGSEHKTDEQ